MKAFLGVWINMGMNPKPELADYFSNSYIDYQHFFRTPFLKFRKVSKKFVEPPHKVLQVVLYLDNKFKQYYVPQHKVNIDESTVGFKGKVLFKDYNKDKPIRWGIKIFVVSESNTGYICGLDLYFGKSTTDLIHRQDLLIVLHLVKKLEEDYDKFYSIFI